MIAELVSRLAGFRNLPPNWDSYGGEPSTHEAVCQALLFVDRLHASPSSDGGVHFESEFCSGTLGFDIAPDGGLDGLYWDRSALPVGDEHTGGTDDVSS